MCLLKTILPKIMNHVFHTISDVFINRPSASNYWHDKKFHMSYPFCVIQNDLVTYKMWSYFIYWVASPVQTFNTWTEKFSTQTLCNTLSKLYELFNPIRILLTYAWFFHPTSIHLYPLLSHFIKLSVMHDNLTLFIKGVALSHSERLIFTVDSYVKVNSLFLDLEKFW